MNAKQCSLAGCLLTTRWPGSKIYRTLNRVTAAPTTASTAETLLVIDHQKKHPYSGKPLHAIRDREKRLEQRIEQLQQQMTEAPPALPVHRVEKMTCEVNQSDDQYGAVVRQMQKRFAPEKFSVLFLPVVSLCPARRRSRPMTC